MSYRDDRDALRARIATLEAQLEESDDSKGGEVQSSALASRSLVAKKVVRHSQTLEGRVSKEGLEGMRQWLWGKLGSSESTEAEGGDLPPSKSVLVHRRGSRVVRIAESGGKTHLYVDHHKRTFVQSLVAILTMAAAVTLGMMASGVHDDWTQMFIGAYAIAVVVLGPLALLRGWVAESESVEILQKMTKLAAEDIAAVTFPPEVRVDTARPVKTKAAAKTGAAAETMAAAETEVHVIAGRSVREKKRRF